MSVRRYNKILMIDRRLYGSEAPNPTYIVAAEYDVATNAVRNVTGAHPPILTPPFSASKPALLQACGCQTSRHRVSSDHSTL